MSMISQRQLQELLREGERDNFLMDFEEDDGQVGPTCQECGCCAELGCLPSCSLSDFSQDYPPNDPEYDLNEDPDWAEGHEGWVTAEEDGAEVRGWGNDRMYRGA